MTTGNAIGWFDIYVADMGRATRFYEAVLKTELQEIVDPTGETQMMSFPANMTAYGAAGALVKSARALSIRRIAAVCRWLKPAADSPRRSLPKNNRFLRNLSDALSK